jgi:thymidylate synthase
LLKIHANLKASDAAAVIKDHLDDFSPAFKTLAIDRLKKVLGDDQSAQQYLRGK